MKHRQSLRKRYSKSLPKLNYRVVKGRRLITGVRLYYTKVQGFVAKQTSFDIILSKHAEKYTASRLGHIIKLCFWIFNYAERFWLPFF